MSIENMLLAPVYNAIFLMVMSIVNITANPCNNFVFHIVCVCSNVVVETEFDFRLTFRHKFAYAHTTHIERV